MLTSATGFVSFTSRSAQQRAIAESAKVAAVAAASSAAAMGRSRLPGPRLVVKSAPQPHDIVWENCSVTPARIKSVSYFTAVFYYVGLLFWSSITALVAALSTLSTFEHFIPALQTLNPIAYAVLEGILPVLVMMGFNWLVEWIMMFTTLNVERRKTNTEIQMRVFKW